jgi:hypothetical protein
VKRTAFVLTGFFLMAGFASPCRAAVFGAGSGGATAAPNPPTAATAPETSPSAGPAKFFSHPSVLMGAGVLNKETGIALAVQCELPKNVIVEVGGRLPQQVVGFAKDNATLYNASVVGTDHVSSYGEWHATFLYPVFRYDRYALTGGLGFSVAAVNDHSDVTFVYFRTPETNSADAARTLVSPMVQLGLSAKLTPHFYVCLDGQLVSYANHDIVQGHTYGLGFNGIIIRPALQWKF